MKNYICEGKRMEVTLTGTIASGEAFLAGSKVVVAVFGGVATDVITAQTEGVFELPKAAGAVTIGQRLYFDATNKNITTTALGNTFAGYAYVPAASGDATVEVMLVEAPAFAQVEVQAASTASDVAGLKTDFNALLTKLKASGIMLNA